MGVVIQHYNEYQGDARSFTIETAFQGGLWFATTAIALALILKGNVQAHRQWMTRSYCTGPLIFLAVRVIGGVTGWENLGSHVNETIVWSCTVCSIFVGDVILQGQELLRNRRSAAKSQGRDARLALLLPQFRGIVKRDSELYARSPQQIHGG